MPRTNASNFTQGNAGEKYIHSHINQLLAHGLVTYNDDTAEDYVEGGDNRIIYNRFGDEATADEYLLDGVVNTEGAGHAITQHLIGGLEVKTISDFLFRNNDMDEPSGTLPFELWNDKERTRLGWLLALLYPALRYRQEEEHPVHAVQPVLFCFLLVSYLGPFACIMFEDFPTLAQRLKELAEERGFKLDPEHIPVGDNATGWQQDDPYIIDNMWHIPFEKIQDLATVTMIGDMPLKKRSIPLDRDSSIAFENLQQARYDFLCQCAEDRSIPNEIQSETDFYPADETHIFADILKNMEIIAHLREEDYPFLYQALKKGYMRAHLNCILLNMYSHPFPTKVGNMIGFLQAKKYLGQWGKMNGIPGSTFSWQAHIIFLTDADLLKKYIDTQRPSNQQVFRSIPRYTNQILEAAERKAKKYIKAGINLTRVCF